MHQVDHSKNIIEVKNVSFSYDGQKILDDVSLNVHHGDYMGMIGPNGGGKSTLLKIILGLLKPSSGTIRLFSKNIGYVPQKATNFDVNFPATVQEVVSMGRFGKKGLFRFLDGNDKKIIDKAIDEVGMSPFQNHLIGNLSGGQQQRVFIARALASEPEIIILDEPTVGVDEQTQEQFYALLKKLNQQLRLTLVLVSHDTDRIRSETTDAVSLDHHLIYHKLLK